MLLGAKRQTPCLLGWVEVAAGAITGVLLLHLVAGCSFLTKPTSVLPSSSPTPGHTPTVSAPSPTATTSAGGPGMPLTLTLWLPPEMLPSTQGTGQFVEDLSRAFMLENPQARVEVVPKAPSGLGGIANFLMTTHAVVPARLPDIVALDASEIRKIAQSGVLIPLDDALSDAYWDDLFPWAVEAVTVNGERLGMPFQVDIAFLVYDVSLTETPPKAWYDLASVKGKYIFPAGRGDGSSADALLLHYFALGGNFGDNPTRPSLDTALLARVLGNYRSAMELGIVPDVVRTLRTLDDCWSSYLAGNAGLTNASSLQYGQDRATLPKARYAPIPTANGESITVARSWAWAVTARDRAHQEMAVRYVALALQPERLVQWSRASYHLPTHRSVLDLAVEDVDYRAFLAEQLEHARPYPSVAYYYEVQDAISLAIEDVLDGVTTPERAAITAAASLARLR